MIWMTLLIFKLPTVLQWPKHLYLYLDVLVCVCVFICASHPARKRGIWQIWPWRIWARVCRGWADPGWRNRRGRGRRETGWLRCCRRWTHTGTHCSHWGGQTGTWQLIRFECKPALGRTCITGLTSIHTEAQCILGNWKSYYKVLVWDILRLLKKKHSIVLEVSVAVLSKGL